MIHQLAAGCPGKLVVASYGQDPKTGIDIVAKVKSFKVGDIDGIYSFIEEMKIERYRNIYIPLATMRSSLPSRAKGGIDDIERIFGFCCDFDDAYASEYLARMPVTPSYVLETSEGNFQCFLFPSRPLTIEEAVPFAQNLCEQSGCCHGTKDLSHVWRIAGQLNWPNQKKVNEGRPETPQLVRVVKQWDGWKFDFDALNIKSAQASLPLKPKIDDQQDDEFFEHCREMISDSDYLDILREENPKFTRLFKGDLSDYKGKSKSAVDMAFCCILAYYTKDPIRIDSLYRSSRLMRVKWDRKLKDTTYGKYTVKRALAFVGGKLSSVMSAYSPEDREVIDACAKREVGDAFLYVKQNKDQYIFDHSEKQWYYWAGNFWRKDLLMLSLQAVDQVIKIYLPLQNNKDIKERIGALNHLGRKERVLKLASIGTNGLGLRGDEWDNHPWLLPCVNGVIDLKDGSISPGEPGQYMRTHCPTPYDPLVPEPEEFLQFLDDIFDGSNNKEHLIAYIQRLFGLVLVGEQIEHALIIFYGPRGRNGKSTFLEVISDILGPFAMSFGSNLLTAQTFTRDRNAHDATTLALRGKRLVITSETTEDAQFDTPWVKKLTGGDTQSGRGAYEKHRVSFKQSHSLILSTNRTPRVAFDEDPFWHRTHVIEFKRTFVEHPKLDYERKHKTDMKKILLKEHEGILRWMVQGSLNYQQAGSLGKPDEVIEQTLEYRKRQDPIGTFVKECLEPRGTTYGKALYEAYEKWAKKEKYTVMSQAMFGRKIKKVVDHKDVAGGVQYEMKVIAP